MGLTLPNLHSAKPSLASISSAAHKPSLMGGSVGKVVAVGAVAGTLGVAAHTVANTGKDLAGKAVSEVKTEEKKAEHTLDGVKDKIEDGAKKGTTLAVSGVKKVGEIGSGMFNMVLMAGGVVILAYMLMK